MSKSRLVFNLAHLHPAARQPFQLLELRLEDGFRAGHTKTWFRPFEGYRTPLRQEHLLNVEKTTKAGAWQSAHNYGLAVDFVPWDPETQKWSWDQAHDWDYLDSQVRNRPVLSRPIQWDRPHVEHQIWTMIKRQVAS